MRATMTVHTAADGRAARIGHHFLSGVGARVVKVVPIVTAADAAAVAGRHQLGWDGRGQGARMLGPGEYLPRLVVNGVQAAKQKAMLLR